MPESTIEKKARDLARGMQEIADKYEGKQIPAGEDATRFLDLKKELDDVVPQVEGMKLAADVAKFLDQPAGQQVVHNPDSGAKMQRKLSDLLPEWDEYKGFTPVEGSFDTKTLFDATPAGATVPEYGPMALIPKETLTVRSIFGAAQTGTDTLKYLKQTLRTNAADFVSPTGQYAESAFGYEWQEDTVKKVGHSLPVSDDTLADRGQMAAILDGEMTYGVAFKIDRALIQGDGSGDTITGILNRTGVQTFDSTDAGFQIGAADLVNSAGQEATYFDVIRRLIFKASNGSAVGFVPDFVGLDTTIAQYLDLVKDSQGRYLMYVQDGKVWRLPIAESRAFTVGTTHHILVGPGKIGAQVFSRRGTNVEVGYVNDQFVHDTKTIKASERLALKVPFPVAFADYSITDDEIAAIS